VQVSSPAAAGIVHPLVCGLLRVIVFRLAILRQATITEFDCFFAIVFKSVPSRRFIPIDRYGLPDCLTRGLSVAGIRHKKHSASGNPRRDHHSGHVNVSSLNRANRSPSLLSTVCAIIVSGER
jgi:hypothetical protein